MEMHQFPSPVHHTHTHTHTHKHTNTHTHFMYFHTAALSVGSLLYSRVVQLVSTYRPYRPPIYHGQDLYFRSSYFRDEKVVMVLTLRMLRTCQHNAIRYMYLHTNVIYIEYDWYIILNSK